MKTIFRLSKDILVGVDLENLIKVTLTDLFTKYLKKWKKVILHLVTSIVSVMYLIKLNWFGLGVGDSLVLQVGQKTKKIAINFENKNICFLCAVTVNLHHIKKLARILIELLILHFHQKLWLGRNSFSLCWKRWGRVCEITPITPI